MCEGLSQALCLMNQAIKTYSERDVNPFNAKPNLQIAVEGGIGSGKSSFLNVVSKSHFSPFCKIIPEPINEWRNFHGSNLLDRVYKQPSFGFSFQTYSHLSLMKRHSSSEQRAIHIQERSVYSSNYVFAQSMLQSGTLDETEYQILSEWLSYFISTNSADAMIDVLLYFRLRPEEAFMRVRERGRKEEKEISLDFMQTIHDCYESWLIRGEVGGKNPPFQVIVVDAERSMEEIKTLFVRSAKEAQFMVTRVATPPCTTPLLNIQRI